ncbi:MAG TPA: translation elongation factor Ts [Mycobacteriales bacterium]|jgi:elongation factor Ts|nr:translation elongation factor Ts [Mycobacteriales bacterium]
MGNFSAADVKRLRELTAAGMMDCKKALEESDGDFDKAIEILRVKGAKDVGKRAGRTAANGLVAHAGSALIELNCETDFVAKNDQFQQLGASIVAVADSARPASVADLLAASLSDGRTVAQGVEAASAVIGEKLVIGQLAVLEAPVVVYLHKRNQDLPPQVGVLVSYQGSGEAAAAAAKAAAMQVAAMRPRYVSRDEVPADVVASERRIAEQTAREEGKPEGAISKIVDGRLNGFFKDSVLLEQPSVQDSKQTVKAILSAAGVTVTGFSRIEVGLQA